MRLMRLIDADKSENIPHQCQPVQEGTTGIIERKESCVRDTKSFYSFLSKILVGSEEEQKDETKSDDVDVGYRMQSFLECLRADHAGAGTRHSANPIATLTGHKDNVLDIAFAPDSKRIVSASRDGTLRLWTIPEGLAESKHAGFEKLVTSRILQQYDTVVAFASNGRYIASGDAEGRVLLWDREGILLEEQPIKPHLGSIATMAFAPDSQYLLVGGIGLPRVNIFRLSDGKQLIGFSKHSKTVLTSAFYSLEQIATADYNGIIHLHELQHYLYDRVKALTDGAQHPAVLLPSTISRFPLMQVEDEENTGGEE